MVLSDRRGPADFYLTKNRACSSLFLPHIKNLSRFPVVSEFNVESVSRVQTQRLDDVFHGDVDFIKLDTQGSELLILKGGTKTLKRVLGVIIEVEFFEHYMNQPLFGDVDAFMRSNHFALMEMKRAYWSGEIAWADCLYLSTDDNLKNEKREQVQVLGKLFNREEWSSGRPRKFSLRWNKIRGQYRLSRYLLRMYRSLTYNPENGQIGEIELGEQ